MSRPGRGPLAAGTPRPQGTPRHPHAPRPQGAPRRPVVAGDHAVTRSRDAGSATLWIALAGCAIVMLGLAAAALGTAVVARHRAQAAADLGALAGARYVIAGEPAACARASAVVVANGGRVVACHGHGLDLVVEAAVRIDVLGLSGTVHAAARAGPVEAVGPGPLPGSGFARTLPAARSRQLSQDRVEHPHGVGLGQRVVAVAALG